MNQFRFAAIESVDINQQTTATAIVLLGGILAAYLGTEIATLGRDWFEGDFVGSFILLALLFLCSPSICFVFMNQLKNFMIRWTNQDVP